MSQYTTDCKEENQWVKDNFTTEEIKFNKAVARLGKKSYDDIIGGLMSRMVALEDFIMVNEPTKLKEVQKLMKDLEYLDEFMSYGDNL